MNNKQLQYAIELSKILNFSLVAEKLGISQPALSKQISSLEKELGVELFNRRKNTVTLSAAGEYFFEEAEKILYREEQLYRSMEDFKSEKCGNLVIGVSPFRSLYLLPPVCKKIKDRYPGIKIILQEDYSDVLRKKVSEGKYDFAIINLPVDESVLDVIPIEPDKLVLAAPKDMVKNINIRKNDNLPIVDFKDCENLPFIVVGQTQEMRILFEKMCSASNIQPKIAMEVVGLTTAWAMACAGIGATLLPMQFINNIDNSDSIQLLIPNFITNIRKPAIITRHNQYLPEYARYAIDILKNQLS